MFKKNFLLNLVNIYTKFFGLILFLITLFLLHNKYVALVISFILLIISRKRKHINYLALITLLVSLINLFFTHLLWLIKILLLIIYLAYLSDIVDVNNVKKLFEKSLYKYRSGFITKTCISVIYFLSLFKKNFIKLDKPRVQYGLVTRFGYFIKLSIKCYFASLAQLKNIILYHKLRFYNIENRRESIDKIETRNYDYYYLGIHFIVLILFIILRLVI